MQRVVPTLRRIQTAMASPMTSISALQHRPVVLQTSSDVLLKSVTKTVTWLQIVTTFVVQHLLAKTSMPTVVPTHRKTVTTMVFQMQSIRVLEPHHWLWSMRTVAVPLNLMMTWTASTTTRTFVQQHLLEKLQMLMVVDQVNSMTTEIPSTTPSISVQ